MLEKYSEVYKLNDYDYYITPWDLEDTIDWYNEEYEDEISIDDIEICNLDSEGMWVETTDSNDIDRLGESDELISTYTKEGISIPEFGDLMRGYDGAIYKFTSYREVINKNYIDNELSEPEVIASTIW